MKEGKIYDTVTFNCAKNIGKDPSKDVLAKKMSMETVEVFGLKTQ